MDITELSKQAVKTAEENMGPAEAFSSTQEQASPSNSLNDAINTHARQQGTEPLRNSSYKNIEPPCDIDDQSRLDLNSSMRKFC